MIIGNTKFKSLVSEEDFFELTLFMLSLFEWSDCSVNVSEGFESN